MHMSLIAGGSDHFVGSASGIFLANLIQNLESPSSIASATTAATTTTWNHQGTNHGHRVNERTRERNNNNNNNIIIDSGHENGRAQIRSSRSPSPESAPPLPSESHASSLLNAYLDHDHICYPFLSITRLRQSFHAVYNASAPSTPSDAFFVDMVLAIGTAQFHKYSWNRVYDAEAHYNRATLKFGNVMAQGGLERLQAVLLVCQYRMGSTPRHATASVWHLIGVAARMCLEMGLHRSTTYKLPSDFRQRNQEQITQLAETMGIKKRCFWSLIAIDRVASIALGRPLAIQLEDTDVDAPSLHNPSSLAPFNGGHDLVQMQDIAPEGTEEESNRAALFAHIVAYRILCGRILNALYRNPKSTVPNDENHFERVRYELSLELHAWAQDSLSLPTTNTTNRDGTDHGDQPGNSSFRSAEWYKLLYHNAVLMLYRPSPCLCDAARNSDTLQRIFESSREAINLYASLHRSKKMNYSWITMHAVFNAGLSHIYALRNHLQSLQASAADVGFSAQLDPRPTIPQVINDTRACSKVLVAVSERWDAAKNCSDLFDRLSDAVLSDLIEAAKIPSTTVAGTRDTPRQTQDAQSLSASAMDMSGGYGDSSINFNYMHMAVDDTFRDCFGDLQGLALDEYHNDALSQLSQEWFLGLGADLSTNRDQ